MNEKCYNAVIGEMQVLLDGQGFKAKDDIFVNEKTAVKVYYDESTKCFNLAVAPIVDESIGEFAVVANWLFDETQTEKDAAAVGVDFADTLRIQLGLKKSVTRGAAQVNLPVAEKGDEVNVLTLTQKLLAIFPEKKDVYKQSVADNGKYLYVDFIFGEFLPEIKKMLANAGTNKKQIKKLFDMFTEIYVEGDGASADMVVSIIAAAIYKDDKAGETAFGFIEHQHLKICVQQFEKELAHNKKLRAALKI